MEYTVRHRRRLRPPTVARTVTPPSDARVPERQPEPEVDRTQPPDAPAELPATDP
jgi:hypothetical protein